VSNLVKQTTTRTGVKGEDFVCTELLKRAFRIIERNVVFKFAEIDIVAEDKDTLCFIEVRTRQNTLWGHPSETVTYSKQKNIRKAAQAYLARHDATSRPIRFDVATVVWKTMEFLYFEDAF
jgi:putative endonuclease